ncbi:hypothetical protein AB0E25_14425, partial [Streptomyces bobili]
MDPDGSIDSDNATDSPDPIGATGAACSRRRKCVGLSCRVDAGGTDASAWSAGDASGSSTGGVGRASAGDASRASVGDVSRASAGDANRASVGDVSRASAGDANRASVGDVSRASAGDAN